MPVQRLFKPDLDTPEICAFLSDWKNKSVSNPGPEYDFGFDTDFWEVMSGYTDTGLRRSLDDTATDIELFSEQRHHYDLYHKNTNRRARAGAIRALISHPLVIRYYAILLIKPATAHGVAIKTAFANYDPSTDEPLKVEQALLASGVPTDDYQVLLSYELARRGSPTVFDSRIEKFTNAVREENAYSIVWGVIEEKCVAPEWSKDEPEDGSFTCVDVTTGSGQSNYPFCSPAAKDAAKRAPHEEFKSANNCEDFELDEFTFISLPTNVEFRIVWVMRPITHNGCVLGKTKVPRLQSRVTTHTLSCTVSYPKNGAVFLKKLIENCVLKSAIAIGLIALVFGGVTWVAAKSAFIAMVSGCISNELDDTVDCILPELFLLRETTEWADV